MTIGLVEIAIIALQACIFLLVFFKKIPRSDDGLEVRFDRIDRSIERVEQCVREEQAKIRFQSLEEARMHRQELSSTLKQVSDSLTKTLSEMAAQQSQGIANLSAVNQKTIEGLRLAIDKRLESLQVNNEQKLEQMRVVVDEKLQGTLEKRLGESFKLVSERLEQVHKGLGEMQTLATGVGDLKKVLTNVRTRGSWGEVVLRNLLDEILTAGQYECNVKTNPSTNELVEFAIKLPGSADDTVWLPLDSKFPSEDYQRLVEAHERADLAGVELAGKQLETRVKNCAKDIRTKYINPPMTTDFAIMFLPSEGLYAEVARRGALLETIQRESRVVISGPATFAAFLNSLQMGFRTVSIERRSSEIWKILGEVKTEFGKFGQTLDGVKKKLEGATNAIDAAAVRSRQIERKLRGVEALPVDGDPQLAIADDDIAGNL